jgi:hypothetical protein
MNTLKRDWPLFVVLLGCVGYLLYLYQTRYIPCETPISYGILHLDEHFTGTKSEYESDLAAAAKVWNDAIGKKIFMYQEPADVPILFYYQAHEEDTTEEYKEARYVSDDKGERIVVYAFDDQEHLRRIFAHELGHALGLEHVGGEDSVMYPINKGNDLRLSAEDKAELERVCNQSHDLKAFIELALERVLG